LINLQALLLSKCRALQALPPLDALTALQTLKLLDCEKLEHLPPLNSLKALNVFNLKNCYKLQQLPPMDCLTALQSLELYGCNKLSGSSLRLPSTEGPGVLVHGLADKKPRILQGEHVVELIAGTC
jgi:hypothetical protein